MSGQPTTSRAPRSWFRPRSGGRSTASMNISRPVIARTAIWRSASGRPASRRTSVRFRSSCISKARHTAPTCAPGSRPTRSPIRRSSSSVGAKPSPRRIIAPGSEIMRARDRSRGRKVALIVDHYVPEPDQDAGSRSMMAIIEALLDAGYVVKFWPDNAKYSPEYTPLLQSIGVETLYGRSGSFDDWIAINGEAIALALLSRPGVAPSYIPALRAHSKATIAYYGHDLHFRRIGMEAEAKGNAELAAAAAAVEAQERAIWRQVDIVLYPSEEEAAVAREETAQAVAIVPYAYETFGDARVPPHNHEILFVAGFGHPPNADAAVWLVKEIFPRILEKAPDARLAIVGSNPTDAVRALAGEQVEVTGRVSEEELLVRYARARLALVPLRTGAGVKSKVVEALREGLPLVTTCVGVQGLPDIEHIIDVANDPEGLAEAAAGPLLDDALWVKASSRQVRYAQKHFSRSAFTKSLLGALNETV